MFYNSLRTYLTVTSDRGNNYGDSERPTIHDENFEEKRKQYLIDKKAQLNVIFNSPSPLTVKEINHYFDLAYNDKNRNFHEGFKKKHLRELTLEEKQKKQALHTRAASILTNHLMDACDSAFDIEIQAAERQARIEEKRKTDKNYTEPTPTRGSLIFLEQYAGGISQNEFLAKDEKTRSEAFLKCLRSLESMMKESLVAQSEEECLTFFEKHMQNILLTGDMERADKIANMVKLFDLENNPAVKQEVDRFIQSYLPIVSNVTSMVNRVTVMADPLYTEVEVGDLCNVQNEIYESSPDGLENELAAEMYLVSKGIEEFDGEMEEKAPLRPFAAFSDFQKWDNFLYAGDKHFVNSQRKIKDTLTETVKTNVKFFLEEICGEKMEDVKFYDPAHPDRAITFDQCQDLFTDMTQGKVGLYAGKDGVLRQVAIDPVLLQIKKPEPIVTLNPNEDIERRITASKMLADLDKVQTYSWTASAEFKRLDTAIRNFAKRDCKSYQASMDAFDGIVKAAQDYINLKRFPEKKMNGKTFKRVEFAKNVLNVFENAKALGFINAKKIDRAPTVTSYIEKVEAAINKQDKTGALSNYVKIVETAEKLPLSKSDKALLNEKKDELKKNIDNKFPQGLYSQFLTEYEVNKDFRNDFIQEKLNEKASENEYLEDANENTDLESRLRSENQFTETSTEDVMVNDEFVKQL